MKPIDWNTEDTYWRENYRSRPYASGNDYTYYQPGYRYGFESAHTYRGKNWDAVEDDLRAGWDKFEYRGKSTWESIKMAVRDAWDRVTGHHPVGTR